MNKRIGIFGGTFDPIHNGHLITIQNVLEKRKLNKIVFIPCNVSPLKTNCTSSDSKHRFNMVKLALKRFPYFDVSDYEIKKGSVSYSIDTILHFKKYYKEVELIIGYDNLTVFDKWYKPDEIIKLSNVIVMRRKDDTSKIKNKYFKSVTILETPTIDISSTEIRKRVKKGLQIDSFVPESVMNYILKNNLYR